MRITSIVYTILPVCIGYHERTPRSAQRSTLRRYWALRFSRSFTDIGTLPCSDPMQSSLPSSIPSHDSSHKSSTTLGQLPSQCLLSIPSRRKPRTQQIGFTLYSTLHIPIIVTLTVPWTSGVDNNNGWLALGDTCIFFEMIWFKDVVPVACPKP